MGKKDQLKYGAIMSYIALLINTIAGFLYTPWMIESIGQNNYGLYILATSLIAMFTMDFGMSQATTRFISKYNAEGDTTAVNHLLGIVYKLYFFISFVIFIILVVSYFYINSLYPKLTSIELETFKGIYVIIGFYTVISFPFTTLDGILSAYEEFVTIKFLDIMNKLLTIFLIVFALYYNKGVYALVLVNAFVGLLIIIVKLYIIKRKLPLKVDYRYHNFSLLKEIFSFSLWTTLSQVFQRLIFSITPSILGMVSGSISMAIFGAASSLEGYAYTFSNAIGRMFLPKVSKIIKSDDSQNEILELMIKVGRIQLFIIALIIIGFVCIGKDFIVKWLGIEFEGAYLCAIFLIFPSIFHTPQIIAQTAIVALNLVKYESVAYIIMGCINLVLSFFLSYFFGPLGASISIFLAYMIRTLILNVIYYKKMKINIFSFIKETYFKMLPLFIFTISFGLISNIVFTSDSWSVICLKGCLIMIVYFIFSWIFVFTNNEKNMIKSIVSK
ncbi:MAG: oligosaccharide flippase family protein [Bacilli bacterium]